MLDLAPLFTRRAGQLSGGERQRAAIARAMALDPLDFTLKSDSTFKFLQVGRTEEAMALAQSVLAHAPGSFDGLGALGNIYDGFGHSSDTYFYQVAGRLGIDRLAYWAHQFGYGEPTGIDLPGEAGGIVPDSEWKQQDLGVVAFVQRTDSSEVVQAARVTLE